MSPTVVLAGGGTAGHVNPLLATAQALEDRGATMVILGTSQGLESDLVPGAGYELTEIPRVPFPRRPSIAALSFPKRFADAVSAAADAMKGADVVVGFGGYVSTPAYWAAKKLNIPVAIHEQNARPGLANRWGARSAALVALTFSSTALKAQKGQTITIGLPLRDVIAELARQRRTPQGRQAAKEQAAARLGLDPALRTLVITGGSLGAVHLNDVMVSVAADLPEGAQVLHLTGKGKDEPVRQGIDQAGVGERWKVLDYLTTMEDALAVADLMVCRSGAGTVAELTALGVPAFYGPVPLGNGEQRRNAAAQVNAGGARLVADSEFTQEVARLGVFALLESDHLEQMGQASARLGQIDAAQVLADRVMDLAHS